MGYWGERGRAFQSPVLSVSGPKDARNLLTGGASLGDSFCSPSCSWGRASALGAEHLLQGGSALSPTALSPGRTVVFCRPGPQRTGMRGQNVTTVGALVLAGFPAAARLRPVLFLLFLLAYLLVLAENLAILLTVRRSAALHRPMCYFLGALSSLEIWYVSDTLPKMLDRLLLQRRRISFAGCMTQLYFFSSLVCAKCVLLASMAYDRHVAICRPLRYHVIMTTGHCVRLVASFACSFSISVVKVYFISSATSCGSNVLNRIFCDISPILKLACTDFSTAELVDFVLAFIILVLLLVATVPL